MERDNLTPKSTGQQPPNVPPNVRQGSHITSISGTTLIHADSPRPSLELIEPYTASDDDSGNGQSYISSSAREGPHLISSSGLAIHTDSPRPSLDPNPNPNTATLIVTTDAASVSQLQQPCIQPSVRQGQHLMSPAGATIHTDSPRPSANVDPDSEEYTIGPQDRISNLRKLAKEAVEATHTAMDNDERNLKSVAFVQYNVAVGLLDKAISCTKSWNFQEDQKQAVALTRINLEANRDNILDRMRVLQAEYGRDDSIGYLHGPTLNPSPTVDLRNRVPPPYVQDVPTVAAGYYGPNDEEGQGTSFGPSTNIGLSLSPDYPTLEGHEVFSIPQNIQIYYISTTDENVSAPSYPSFLRIVLMNDEPVPSTSATIARPPAFLQVGDWTYPLIPGQSPVYKASLGSYIFPDLSSEGSSIGLVFPSDISNEERMMFDDIMLQLLGLEQFPSSTILEKSEKPVTVTVISSEEVVTTITTSSEIVPELPEDESEEVGVSVTASRSSEPCVNEGPLEYSTSQSIASNITSAAEFIAQGLVYGAHRTTDYINAGANYVMDRITPVAHEPVIKPEVKTTVKTVKHVSVKAVKVSGFLVNQVGRATVMLGRAVGPYIQTATAKVWAKTTNKTDEEARKSVDGAFQVTGACIVGVGTLYVGLEEAAKIMAKSIGNNTVRIVDKRYGHQAGCLADDTVSTLGYAATAGFNVQCLGPKSITKRLIKEAGLSAIMEREGLTPASIANSSTSVTPTIATPPRSVVDMAVAETPPVPPARKSQSDSARFGDRSAPPRPPPPSPRQQ